ncbi:kringle domain protein [Dictyocaulus viviparus]|uniref:Kringle domain protein n=1 Tax=Dictyocaulus viviparus TaxID=29172 RepID=A0A0D8X531_DICVI|nr:kringle domain protein [Dictyocaulus viviparus]
MAPKKFPLKSFSNFSSPSMDYMTLNVYSTTISQHENYCRNPDNHKLGPWCFYKEENEIRRAPCFHTCVTDITHLCLAKAFFPFYQTPYSFDTVPLSPVDPRVLRSVDDTNLKKKNARLGHLMNIFSGTYLHFFKKNIVERYKSSLP